MGRLGVQYFAMAKTNYDILLNQHYTTGRDVTGLPPSDWELLSYDLWTNLAHAKMLSGMKPAVLGAKEFQAIKKAILTLDKTYAQGKLNPDFGIPGSTTFVEDIHYWIENQVTKRTGAKIGGKLHTARSRNDQVTCDMRLFMRQECLKAAMGLVALIQSLAKAGQLHRNFVMPGFTHHQHAAASSLGFLWISHAQALLRDLERLKSFYAEASSSPLGAVMGFGTSWPIDRKKAATYLGFEEVQDNNLDVVTNRGELETSFVAVLAFMSKHLAGLAQDILLLSTEEYNMIKIHPSFTTGSSVMPQKQNCDFAELTKAKAGVLAGQLQALLSINKGNSSGYNRDSQASKSLVMDAAREMRLAPLLFARVIATLGISKANQESMKTKSDAGYLNAVDIADYLAAVKGVPFRKAHAIVKSAVDLCRNESPPAPALTLDSLNKSLKKHGSAIELTFSEVRSLSDSSANLNLRRNQGSPKPADVLRQSNQVLAQSKKAHAWWTIKTKHVASVRTKLFGRS